MKNVTVKNASHSAETLWHSLNTLSVTRVLIAGILLILWGLNSGKYIWFIDPGVYRFICLFYLTGAVVFVGLQRRVRYFFLWHLGAQVVFDIAIISVLFYYAGGINSSLAILFLFPLASCAILAPLVWALFLSSVVVLYILVISSVQVLQLGTEAAISSAGLYGAAFLAIVYAVNRLANRLIRQEELAHQHGTNLRIQQEINNVIVADMSDGILVVDAASRIYICNPASKEMLGVAIIPEKTQLSDLAGLYPVAEAFFSWRHRIVDREVLSSLSDNAVEESFSSSVTVKGVRRDVLTHLKLRFVAVNAELGSNEVRFIIFLQDASEIENQAQQLKLASMGRLTASIAHEVRNPLSSISYAAALLTEADLSGEQSSRMIKIVSDNVVRLNRLIEDILRLSRKVQINLEPFLLKQALEEILTEIQQTRGLAEDIIQFNAPDALMIRFDPIHLREVLVNLLINALRYASGGPGSIQLFVVADLDDQLELHVHDDGPGITAEVRSHLFEPFYTTSSHGTGLGLYMARELCLNNGALLDYEYRVTQMKFGDADDTEGAQAKGRFVITFVKPR